MKKIRFRAILFLIVGLYLNAGAQNGGSTKITVFKPGDDQTFSDPKPSMIGEKAIKWNYSMLSRGLFFLSTSA